MKHVSANGNKIFLLVVEDSPTQAEELRYFLEANNYGVTVCHDGQEALEWLQAAETKPDVVISDIQMPRMDGYELCRTIRNEESLKGLPIILLTSLSDPQDIIQSIEAGANKFLTKPFDHERLPELVNELYINTQRRSKDRMEMGIKLFFGGDEFLITADKVQILDLLLSSYEETYFQNRQLQEAQSALENLNAELEGKVQDRTRELREREEQFRTLAEHLPDLIMRFNRGKELVYTNQAVERLTGMPRDRLIGHSVEELEKMFIACSCGQLLNTTFQTGTEQHNEYSFMGLETRKWLDATFVPEYDEQGEIAYALKVSRDITESKQAREALEENQHYLRSLLDSQPNIVVINDGEKLVDTNREFFRFFSEYDSLEAFRKSHRCICEFFEPSEHPGFLTARMEGKSWTEVLQAHPQDFYKVKMVRKDREYVFSVKMETVRIREREQHIISFSDITEMEQLQRNLETRVAEEVEKQRLREQQLLQQSKIVQMGEMVTNISHHWRQPLNFIALSAQDLLDAYSYGEMDKSYLETSVHKTMETVTKMSETINSFRDFMVDRAEKKRFDPAEAVRRSVEILRPAIEEQRISLHTELTDKMESFGDPNLLENALYHLLANAREVLMERKTEQGRIDVSLRRGEKGEILLVVQDNGGGIDKAALPRIFEPFFTTKGLAAKTGTGLYFAKTSIENELGGTLWAENRNDGACFAIRIPPAEKRIYDEQQTD